MTTTPFKRLAIAFASGAALVAGLSACVPLVVGGAAAVGMGMVGCYLCLLWVADPWARRDDDRLHLLSWSALVLVLVLGLSGSML